MGNKQREGKKVMSSVRKSTQEWVLDGATSQDVIVMMGAGGWVTDTSHRWDL